MATTHNGCSTNKTTGSVVLDLFFRTGSSRGQNLTTDFRRAYADDADLTVRLLQYMRDVRQGQGEREQFRRAFADMIKYDVELARRVLAKVPELGRWDDVLVAVDTPLEQDAFSLIVSALLQGNGLCAKWMPRPTGNEKNKEIANKLRKFMGFTPKEYRQLVVGLSKTVEQQMCAREWSAIDYNHVPSVAAGRYTRAFQRNDARRYNEYIEKLTKGDASVKVNAGAMYPHEVIGVMRKNAALANAQWKALPDFLEGTDERILPIIDVSGSMSCALGTPQGAEASQYTCMDVAIALGMYVAERNIGPFKDEFITFDTTPRMMHMPDANFQIRHSFVSRADWGGSTNFVASFQLILDAAKKGKLSQEQLPTTVLVLSDMEFDRADRNSTAMDTIRKRFAEAGYTMPRVIYWNLNARPGNNPVTAHQTGTALVSGYSASILGAILGKEMKDATAMETMLVALMNPRYDY